MPMQGKLPEEVLVRHRLPRGVENKFPTSFTSYVTEMVRLHVNYFHIARRQVRGEGLAVDFIFANYFLGHGP